MIEDKCISHLLSTLYFQSSLSNSDVLEEFDKIDIVGQILERLVFD